MSQESQRCFVCDRTPIFYAPFLAASVLRRGSGNGADDQWRGGGGGGGGVITSVTGERVQLTMPACNIQRQLPRVIISMCTNYSHINYYVHQFYRHQSRYRHVFNAYENKVNEAVYILSVLKASCTLSHKVLEPHDITIIKRIHETVYYQPSQNNI